MQLPASSSPHALFLVVLSGPYLLVGVQPVVVLPAAATREVTALWVNGITQEGMAAANNAATAAHAATAAAVDLSAIAAAAAGSAGSVSSLSSLPSSSASAAAAAMATGAHQPSSASSLSSLPSSSASAAAAAMAAGAHQPSSASSLSSLPSASASAVAAAADAHQPSSASASTFGLSGASRSSSNDANMLQLSTHQPPETLTLESAVSVATPLSVAARSAARPRHHSDDSALNLALHPRTLGHFGLQARPLSEAELVFRAVPEDSSLRELAVKSWQGHVAPLLVDTAYLFTSIQATLAAGAAAPAAPAEGAGEAAAGAAADASASGGPAGSGAAGGAVSANAQLPAGSAGDTSNSVGNQGVGVFQGCCRMLMERMLSHMAAHAMWCCVHTVCTAYGSLSQNQQQEQQGGIAAGAAAGEGAGAVGESAAAGLEVRALMVQSSSHSGSSHSSRSGSGSRYVDAMPNWQRHDSAPSELRTGGDAHGEVHGEVGQDQSRRSVASWSHPLAQAEGRRVTAASLLLSSQQRSSEVPMRQLGWRQRLLDFSRSWTWGSGRAVEGATAPTGISATAPAGVDATNGRNQGTAGAGAPTGRQQQGVWREEVAREELQEARSLFVRANSSNAVQMEPMDFISSAGITMSRSSSGGSSSSGSGRIRAPSDPAVGRRSRYGNWVSRHSADSAYDVHGGHSVPDITGDGSRSRSRSLDRSCSSNGSLGRSTNDNGAAAAASSSGSGVVSAFATEAVQSGVEGTRSQSTVTAASRATVGAATSALGNNNISSSRGGSRRGSVSSSSSFRRNSNSSTSSSRRRSSRSSVGTCRISELREEGFTASASAAGAGQRGDAGDSSSLYVTAPGSLHYHGSYCSSDGSMDMLMSPGLGSQGKSNSDPYSSGSSYRSALRVGFDMDSAQWAGPLVPPLPASEEVQEAAPVAAAGGGGEEGEGERIARGGQEGAGKDGTVGQRTGAGSAAEGTGGQVPAAAAGAGGGAGAGAATSGAATATGNGESAAVGGFNAAQGSRGFVGGLSLPSEDLRFNFPVYGAGAGGCNGTDSGQGIFSGQTVDLATQSGRGVLFSSSTIFSTDSASNGRRGSGAFRGQTTSDMAGSSSNTSNSRSSKGVGGEEMLSGVCGKSSYKIAPLFEGFGEEDDMAYQAMCSLNPAAAGGAGTGGGDGRKDNVGPARHQQQQQQQEFAPGAVLPSSSATSSRSTSRESSHRGSHSAVSPQQQQGEGKGAFFPTQRSYGPSSSSSSAGTSTMDWQKINRQKRTADAAAAAAALDPAKAWSLFQTPRSSNGKADWYTTSVDQSRVHAVHSGVVKPTPAPAAAAADSAKFVTNNSVAADEQQGMQGTFDAGAADGGSGDNGGGSGDGGSSVGSGKGKRSVEGRSSTSYSSSSKSGGGYAGARSSTVSSSSNSRDDKAPSAAATAAGGSGLQEGGALSNNDGLDADGREVMLSAAAGDGRGKRSWQGVGDSSAGSSSQSTQAAAAGAAADGGGGGGSSNTSCPSFGANSINEVSDERACREEMLFGEAIGLPVGGVGFKGGVPAAAVGVKGGSVKKKKSMNKKFMSGIGKFVKRAANLGASSRASHDSTGGV